MIRLKVELDLLLSHFLNLSIDSDSTSLKIFSPSFIGTSFVGISGQELNKLESTYLSAEERLSKAPAAVWAAVKVPAAKAVKPLIDPPMPEALTKHYFELI